MTSASVTKANIKDTSLAQVLCIYYPVQFQKSNSQVWAFVNSKSKVNTMNPAYAKKLDLWIQKTNVGAQKIDGSSLNTFKMVIASF